MDRCDCDSAGEVDDSRGWSHLFEETTLDVNGRPRADGGIIVSILHRSLKFGMKSQKKSHLSSDVLTQEDYTQSHAPGAIGVPATTASQWVGGPSPPATIQRCPGPRLQGHCPCPAATQPAVVIAARSCNQRPSTKQTLSRPRFVAVLTLCGHWTVGMCPEWNGAAPGCCGDGGRAVSHELVVPLPRIIMMACIEDRERPFVLPSVLVLLLSSPSPDGRLSSRPSGLPSFLPPFDAPPHARHRGRAQAPAVDRVGALWVV